MTTPGWMKPPPDGVPPLLEIDTSVAHPARVWDFWLGGRDHYAADRELGTQILQALPDFGSIARADREFLGRAVRHLAGDVGIRQFLDIGTGIPTANNTHEVAQSVAPESVVLYVDNDPIVMAHAQALLTSNAAGSTRFIQADLREPDEIVRAAAQTLDLSRPVAVTLLGIMEFVPEAEQARAIVRTLMDAVPAGSHLVVSHPVPTPEMIESARLWNAGGAIPVTIRTPEESASLFDGLELLEPGIVGLPQWRTEPGTRYTDRDFPYHGAVARKA